MALDLLDGSKTVRIELMVTEDMAAAIMTEAREIGSPGDGSKHRADAVRRLIARGLLREDGSMRRIHAEARAEARAQSKETLRKSKEKWARQKSRA